MKYIITENKLNKVALSWMNQNFSSDQLEIVKSEEYPNSVFFILPSIFYILRLEKSKYFYFDYEEIWLFFELFFDLGYGQIQEVLRYWLEKTFKLESYTPNTPPELQVIGWRGLSN